MDRAVRFCLILALAAGALCTLPTAHAALPKNAGISEVLMGQWGRALARLPEAQDANRAEKYFRAWALMESGRVDEALTLLTGLSSTPGAFGGTALEMITEYAFEMGRFDEIVAAGELIEGKRFQKTDAMNYRVGQSYYMAGQFERAKLLLEKVEIARWRVYARHTLALMAYDDGDSSVAIERIGEALKAAQAHPDRVISRALVDRLRLVRGRVIHQAALRTEGIDEDSREKLFKVAISQLVLVTPKRRLYAQALRTIGWCAAEMGDSVRAIASFETAMSVDPERAHEDLWATGRVFERLGYFEQAADYYFQARAVALDFVEILEKNAEGDLELPTNYPRKGWVGVAERLSVVSDRVDAVHRQVVLSIDAANHRAARLDEVEKRLDNVSYLVKDMSQELVKMDADLYHYLDIIPASSLFQKKDRPRIQALLDKQERLLSQMLAAKKALETLERTRAWKRAPDLLRDTATALWQRLEQGDYNIVNAQLAFLEGMKFRVSVREKELMRLVDARKQENQSLHDPLSDNRTILAYERDKLVPTVAGLDQLAKRADKLSAELAELKDGADRVLVDEYRQSIRERAKQIKLRADEFSLDEAQALHLWEESGGQ
jgi:tetratricopeptide (TPR) repeat protein